MAPKIKKKRTEAIDLLGGKCKECGSTERLQFDHIDPISKSFHISGHVLVNHWGKVIEELKKCQLLCPSCHGRKNIRERNFTREKAQHGSLARYGSRHKCRCQLCKKAWSDYQRLRRGNN